MSEIWKPVLGFEKFYEVSNLGRVKSLYRHIKRSDGTDLRLNERILKPGLSGYPGSQYYMVVLTAKGKKRTAKVHRLMCESFYGIDSTKKYVNHIDGNKQNNLISNLEWCTSSENQKHAYKTGLRQRNVGITNGRCKLNEATVRTIKSLLRTDMPQIDIARHLGVNVVRVNSMKAGRTWTHI